MEGLTGTSKVYPYSFILILGYLYHEVMRAGDVYQPMDAFLVFRPRQSIADILASFQDFVIDFSNGLGRQVLEPSSCVA